MNAAPPAALPLFAASAEAGAGLPWRETRFVADWRRMLFVHYAVAPEALAPHVPFPLDCREGKAFVSLVWFSLERMRPCGTGGLGRFLLRPISDHAFLNVRTYVRPTDGPGIYFVAEWIPNRLSLRLGPATYGLPYRLGEIRHTPAGSGGVAHLRVHGTAEGADLSLSYPIVPLRSPACADRARPRPFSSNATWRIRNAVPSAAGSPFPTSLGGSRHWTGCGPALTCLFRRFPGSQWPSCIQRTGRKA